MDAITRQPPLDVFCFPQAGADSAGFATWQPKLSQTARIVPVPLPGRGRRFGEPAIADFTALCDLIFRELRPQITGPFALMGSSMGGWIAYELALRLEQAGQPPALVVPIASPMPGVGRPLPELDNPARAVADIVAFNPAFAEAAAYPELVELILPTIRTDFRMCNRYAPQPGRTMCAPMIGFAGDADTVVDAAAMAGWDALTTGGYDLTVVPGDHALHERPPQVLLDRLIAAFAKVRAVAHG